jgi:NitT/TauT family transport system permease protein
MSSQRPESESTFELQSAIDADSSGAYAVEQALAYGESADSIATSADTGMEAVVGAWRSPGGQLLRTILGIALFLLVAGLVWEAFKWLAGDPWRFPAFGYEHRPPFRLMQAQDLQLPHLWDIGSALIEPVQRNADQSLGQFLIGAAFVTWVEAALGFLVGTLVGILLATLFVHSLPAERAFVPYVIASQTIPIIALAPLLIEGVGRGLASVVFIAAYLTFFPVTIAAMRGLRSPDPRALELMRSYAASRWSVYRKVRLPASLPYLFTAFKIAATASVVGAIIGEDPAGTANGLGRAIVNFNQQYVTGPEKLWATILVAGMAGILFYLLVRLVEAFVLRNRRPGAM